MKKPKLIYVLPRYRQDISTHEFFLYGFIEALSSRYDLWLIVLEGDTPVGHLVGPKQISYFGNSSWLVKVARYKMALVWARLKGYRLVYVHYSYWAAIVASFLLRPLGGKVFYWNCGMPWLFGPQHSLRFVLRVVNTLVTGTKSMAMYYSRQYGIPLSRTAVMPNWIDIERFQDTRTQKDAREAIGVPSDVPVVLFDHKLVPRKGADFLPDILSALPDNVHLVVVGGGELFDSLNQEFASRGLSHRVHMAGWVPARDIPLYMKAADLYLMCSREEGFPRTILESMASGTPFVASDVGGMLDIVPLELQAYLVASLDEGVESFVEAVKKLLDDKKLREDIRNQLVAEVERYDTPRVVDIFTSIVN